MEKVLEDVIKSTQNALGKYVKRPPLTEKLLRKPPFRFLHDIVTNVLKNTGFFEGLFDEEELVSENVKDRENKILFLNKVIAVIGLTLGKTLSVKSSKIVAGQEPEKTNELLQCLAHALDEKLSSANAVQKYKEESLKTTPLDKKSKDPAKAISDSNKLSSRSNEKLTKKTSSVRTKPETEKPIISKTKQKEKTVVKNESPPKKISQQKANLTKKSSIDKKSIKENINDKLPNGNVSEDIILVNKSEVKTQLESDITSEADSNLSNQNDHPQNLNSSYTIIDHLNSSISSQELQADNEIKNTGDSVIDLEKIDTEKEHINANDNQQEHESHTTDGINVIETSKDPEKEENKKNEHVLENAKKEMLEKKNERPVSVRPSSSRPGAPRLRDKHDAVLSETENILVGKVNIISENAPNEEEEDTSTVVVEKDSILETSQEESEQFPSALSQHGHLVQQILTSQKEYSQMSGKTEIEWEFGAQKARDAASKEIEQLRFDLQALSRVANPLGKLLDHIQEDVEVMRQELLQWTNTYEETSKELSKQMAANEDSLTPLRTKVKQLDTEIIEKRDKVNDLKIVIHKNSSRIEKLIANGNVQY